MERARELIIDLVYINQLYIIELIVALLIIISLGKED